MIKRLLPILLIAALLIGAVSTVTARPLEEDDAWHRPAPTAVIEAYPGPAPTVDNLSTIDSYPAPAPTATINAYPEPVDEPEPTVTPRWEKTPIPVDFEG